MRTSGTVGEAGIAWATAENFTPDELCRLRAALPADMPLDFLPLDVARAYLLWRGIPATFVKFRDENGDSTGFSWEYDHTWRRRHPDRFEAFWRFQDTSSVLWRWMSDHQAEKITSENLLPNGDRLWSDADRSNITQPVPVTALNAESGVPGSRDYVVSPATAA